MKKFLKNNLLNIILITFILALPILSLAQTPDTGLVPCDGSEANPCGFKQIGDLINTVIDFVFKDLVLPLAAIMFAYAGFELVTSGGSTEKKSKAKKIFINVAIGLIFAAASFLIIQTILVIVGYDTGNGWNWFGF